VIVFLGLIVRLRFPPIDRSCLKPACGLGHGMAHSKQHSLLSVDITLIEMVIDTKCGSTHKV